MEENNKILDILKQYIEVIDDEVGYGITIKGLYTYKVISIEEYNVLLNWLNNK